jgi:predicted DNA-binding protein
MPANFAAELPAKLENALRNLSNRTGVPRSAIVTRLLENYLYGSKNELPAVTSADREKTANRETVLRKSVRRGLGDTRG